MLAQQKRIDAIANNLANVNTPGFKRSRVTFEDMLYETLQGTGIVNYQSNESVQPMQIGRGVRLATIQRVHTKGSAEMTNGQFDLMIDGSGFFKVQRPDGSIAYTRDGSFRPSDNGTLVNHSGYAVLPEITIPGDTTGVSISPDGFVSITVEGTSDVVELGQIQLARFMNPAGLETLGENLYAETAASGTPIEGYAQENGFGRVLQGCLEASNVEIVQEMVDMIAAQRAYEVNSRAIRTADEMIERAVNGIMR
jgi:flagellar basal-body rod protein FlgG